VLFNGAQDSSAEDSVLIASLYRNLVYANAPSTSGVVMVNFDYNPDTWTNAQSIFDNLLQTNNATGQLNNIPSSNFVSTGSTVDYNTYYAPNASGNFLQNAQSGVTFAAWKALRWDMHGANVNPGWTAPASCNFGTWPY
jgi:hypothetical protein